MSVTPVGKTIQNLYNLYRTGEIIVNRRYQRKLVWTHDEKVRLIDSILRGLPIPLILLAEIEDKYNGTKYEVIDGVQRLHSIFSFIENDYPLDDGRYFDTSEFTRASQYAEEGLFETASENESTLSAGECADILDYTMAVTEYPASGEDEITEVFGRINSYGRQLSNQEKRQAGVISNFAELVRVLSSEIRGDTSHDSLKLYDMPEISIDSSRSEMGYGLRADEIFWCKQGILRNSQLRDSEDEEMIADILASILLEEPFARSKEEFNKLYNPDSNLYDEIESAVASYPADILKEEVKITFSVLREVISDVSEEDNYLRDIANPGSYNPIKAAFYSIFMSFYSLIVTEEKSPDDSQGIMNALQNIQNKLEKSAHYTKPKDRIENINMTIGLIQPYFVDKEPPVLTHGPGLSIDLENSLRRSKVESNRYECKQGLLSLGQERNLEESVLSKIVKTTCGISNIGPESEGYIFIGVADSKPDADRISDLDGTDPVQVGERYVVGIDRELDILEVEIDTYVDRVIGYFKQSQLTEPLPSQTLSSIDIVDYKGHSVVRIKVPNQDNISFVGDNAYTRQNSSTEEITGPELISVNKMFTA